MTRPPDRKRWLILLGIAMAAFYVGFGAIEQSLPEGTPGVLQYEFVGSEDRAAEMRAEWGDAGRDDIRLSLLIDYGFMLVYGAFFAIAALATRDFAGERGLDALAAAGRWAPWCAVGAAVFDAIENTFLLIALGGNGGNAAPPLATAAACVKFLLLALVLAYVLWGLAARLRGRGE